MKLKLKRIALKKDYTIGKLYIDDVYFCDTLEDTVRDLNKNGKFKKKKKKVCPLCADKNLKLDYKNADQLRKFVNEKGKILPRRATGACAIHQRDITLAVKRARQIAVLPYTAE